MTREAMNEWGGIRCGSEGHGGFGLIRWDCRACITALVATVRREAREEVRSELLKWAADYRSDGETAWAEGVETFAEHMESAPPAAAPRAEPETEALIEALKAPLPEVPSGLSGVDLGKFYRAAPRAEEPPPDPDLCCHGFDRWTCSTCTPLRGTP